MSLASLPFSQACENNKQPILDVLEKVFSDRQRVLEIGSGTGQHAVFFSEKLPHLIWQCTERAQELPDLQARIRYTQANTLPEAIELDVEQAQWPVGFDAAFSANTAHIMPWHCVERSFTQLARSLNRGAIYALYGPFNYGGQYTSESNARFDLWLKERAAHQGIRDFERVKACAESQGFAFIDDIAMPANNRILLWRLENS